MKRICVVLIIFLSLLAFPACAAKKPLEINSIASDKETVPTGQCNENNKFVLVIHGGAFSREDKSLEERASFIEGVLAEGKELLAEGATSLEVVHFAIKSMEDTGLFNAGKGSIKNQAGYAEMDASIMDGKDLEAGAVASVSKEIKNPITAAKLILEKSDNVMFVGKSAEEYVNKIANLESGGDDYGRFALHPCDLPGGTVGAVALDRCGNLAAGTSTGGFGSKIPGRVGDSPIIGAGTYANDQVAVSSTGHGEFFIRWAVAHDIVALYSYKNLTIEEAAEQVISKIGEKGGTGGVIALDFKGNIATPFNTKGMLRGYVTNESEPEVSMY
jgi:beta-aspartyl-peptidase (threonine type)